MAPHKSSTRNVVSKVEVPSLKVCDAKELPENVPATYNDILCYRKLLVDRDSSLAKSATALSRLILREVTKVWKKMHPHVELKGEKALLEMLRHFFHLVKNANDRSAKGHSRNRLKLKNQLKRVANCSICKCKAEFSIDCR